jgi:diguanylate cyclase (GGDEF)-like protein
MACFARTLGALAKGAHMFVCEAGYLRLDGVARLNELTLLVMPGHEHSLDFVIVSTVDITERKRANEELLVLATTDFLTGLPNRREFMARLDAEQNRLQRDVGGRAAVLMLDLDHFKDINDEYGHAVGDAVLRHLAGLMRDSQRKIDVLGRVGGEEFAALLPGADLEAAHVFAERLRQRIAETPLLLEGHSFAVTVSVGIAALEADDPRGDAALVRADKALYCAKRSGRNKVVV